MLVEPTHDERSERGGSGADADRTRRISLERVRGDVAGAGDAVYDWDMIADRIVWSENAAVIIKFPQGAAPSTPQAFEASIASSDRAIRAGALFRHIDERSDYDCRYRLRLGDARHVWVHDRGLVTCSRDGRAKRMVGSLKLVRPPSGVETDARRRWTADAPSPRSRESHRRGRVLRDLRPSLHRRRWLCPHRGGTRVRRGAAREMVRRVEHGVRIALRARDYAAMAAIAAKLMRAVREYPYDVRAGPARSPSISIGGVVIPVAAGSVTEAMARAEQALAVARSTGGRRFVPYRPTSPGTAAVSIATPAVLCAISQGGARGVAPGDGWRRYGPGRMLRRSARLARSGALLWRTVRGPPWPRAADPTVRYPHGPRPVATPRSTLARGARTTVDRPRRARAAI
jgi:hypothetical protein